MFHTAWTTKQLVSQEYGQPKMPHRLHVLYCEVQCLVLNILFKGQEGNKANEGGDTTVLGRDKKMLTPIDLSILVSRARR